MRYFITLKNNTNELITLLTDIKNKFKVKNTKIFISLDKGAESLSEEDFNRSNSLEITLEHHLNRLIVTNTLLDYIDSIDEFSLKTSYFNLRKSFSLVKKLNDLIFKNVSLLYAAMSKLNELDSKLLANVLFKNNEVIFNTRSLSLKEINSEYNFIDIFNSNESFIQSLTSCLSGFFITYKMKEFDDTQKKLAPYIELENTELLTSLIKNKNEYNSLLGKLIENKQEINQFQTKQINFQKVIEQYQQAKLALDEKSKEVAEILNESSKNLNTYKDMSSFLNSEYSRLKDKKESIDGALNSIDEINKAGEDSRKINDYVDNRKNEIEEILKDARETISILSGSAIAEHLYTQEKKESLAARGWLALSGLLMGLSLYYAVRGYNESIFDWNFFTLKILTLPILLSSLFFSMRQYIKRKNIVDSYSYKKTLALSLTGFKKQIDKSINNEEQIAYVLKTIEILTESPLNSLDKNHIKNDLDALEKMRESVIDNVISTIKNQTTDKKEKKQSTTE